MATADVTTSASTAHDGPRPPTGIGAELVETPAGWALTVHCDPATALALRAVGADLRTLGQLSICIKPNLVPGEPFAIDTVLIEVDDPSSPPTERSTPTGPTSLHRP